MTERDYEALIILKTAGTEQELAKHATQLEEQVKRISGNIERSQSMGRRRLAFRINRQSEGHYHLLRFRAPTERVAELERLFRLNETVVRFIILNADEAPVFAPAPRAAVAGSAAPARS